MSNEEEEKKRGERQIQSPAKNIRSAQSCEDEANEKTSSNGISAVIILAEAKFSLRSS